MIVWQDTLLCIQAVFYCDEFLSASSIDVIKAHSRDILINNHQKNPNYWCACVLYELKEEKRCGSTPYMDYIIIFPGIRSDF